MRKTSNDSLYRAKLVLTEEGHKIAGYIAQRAIEVISAVGNDLTDEERKQFYSTLDFIAFKLQAISKEGIPQK